jgi:hypothetical protein
MDTHRTTAAVGAIRAALSRNQLALILGAGVSAAATNVNPLSLWPGLVKHAIEHCVSLGERDEEWANRARADVSSPYDGDLIAAAEKATSGMGGRTSAQYRSWLRNSVGSLRIDNSTLTEVINRCAQRGSLIATTNYDGIAAAATGWPVVTWRDSTMIQRVFRRDDDGVLHLHGHWNDPSSVVFGSSSYADVLRDQHSGEFLKILLYGKTVVFVGFSAGLRDPNFTALRNWLRTYPEAEYSHYRLVRDEEVHDAETEHHPDEHITVVPFGANHSDLPAFLASILSTGMPRAVDDTDEPPPSTLPPTARSSPAMTPPASQQTREELVRMADRLTAVQAVIADTSSSTPGPANSQGRVVRDEYIRFYNLFADEAEFVASAASDPQLIQADADEAVGVGRRLIALLDNPPQSSTSWDWGTTPEAQ